MILLIGGLGNVGKNLETHFKRTTDQDVFVLGRKPEHIVKKLYPDTNYIEQDLLDFLIQFSGFRVIACKA